MGQIYEAKVHTALSEQYGKRYLASPWFHYWDESANKARFCQPDALYIDVERGRIIIVEIKLKHTSDAWWQLRKKYEPVVKKAFGGDFSYAVAEVVRWYDPMLAFPEEVIMRPEIAFARPRGFQVTIWNPR